MIGDARFGLPLSLVEALRADASHDAAEFADLLVEQEPPPPAPRRGRPRFIAFAGLALAASLSVDSFAATTTSLQGRWEMTPQNSAFRESVTGPAPDRAVMLVSRDDRNRLTYELVESREGAEVARGAYDISFSGAPSTSSVGGEVLPVTGARDVGGDVLIRAPAVDGDRAFIRVRQTGPNTARLEHDVETANGPIEVEGIALVRADQSASR